MATVLRNDAKQEIMHILREQGYAPYARLVNLFDIYLTDDPRVIGYMEPGKAKIVLNEDLSIRQVSVIVRHEILHEYLDHQRRQLEYEERTGKRGSHETANIAMDYEISNRGYTDSDKGTARAIILGNKTLRGLVTEDDFPEWEKMSFEEMYEQLIEKEEQDKEKMKKILDRMKSLNQKDLDDLQDQLQDQSDSQGGSPQDGPPQDAQGKGSDSEDDTSKSRAGSDEESDKEESSGQKKGSGTPQDKTAELADKVQDIKDELADMRADGSVFDTDAEQKRKEELAKKVADIQRAFADIKTRDEVFQSSSQAIAKERAARRAIDTQRRNADPLTKFRLNLNRFVKEQISEIEDDTYTRMNPRYEDSEFILPGTMIQENKFIPKINVYHDVSASFSDPAKTEMAMRAIDSLNKYVRDGDIEVDVFYFADRVSSTKKEAGGGTRGTPILEHIKQTKPTNVIVITDSDINDCSEALKVPGAVWMLFYGSRSQNLIDHLRGKRETRYYDVTW